MVTSKTHLHAFEIISAGESLIVMSGSTELESRDWIWTLRKLFWPDALEHIDTHGKISYLYFCSLYHLKRRHDFR
jgi:hypothetical protein